METLGIRRTLRRDENERHEAKGRICSGNERNTPTFEKEKPGFLFENLGLGLERILEKSSKKIARSLNEFSRHLTLMPQEFPRAALLRTMQLEDLLNSPVAFRFHLAETPGVQFVAPGLPCSLKKFR